MLSLPSRSRGLSASASSTTPPCSPQLCAGGRRQARPHPQLPCPHHTCTHLPAQGPPKPELVGWDGGGLEEGGLDGYKGQ